MPAGGPARYTGRVPRVLSHQAAELYVTLQKPVSVVFSMLAGCLASE